MKSILILGKGSYIGESLYRWLSAREADYSVAIASTLNEEWKQTDFSAYDTVVDLAGIAHINHIKKSMEELFYSVNRDLTVQLGEHAKKAGVRHFIYFSSMNVYGEFCGAVQSRDAVAPTNFYGDSKLQGELGLKQLADERFAVSILRPPFVYGHGCKGNYNTISKIARRTPIFPTYRNKKSMIYIDNLTELVRLIIEDGRGGVFTPQNRELVSTSELVRAIAQCHGKRIWFTGLFNWAIPLGNKLSGTVRRAFADDCYREDLSDQFDFRYCVVDFRESIRRTEQGNDGI